MDELNAKRAAWARRYFQQEVFPMLTPLAVDASHPFPQLLNKSHNLLVRARAKKGGDPLYAIVQVPRAVSRLIHLPRGDKGDESLELHLPRLAHQTACGRSFPRSHRRRRARLSRHAEQRSLRRRRRSGQPAAQHRTGTAAIESRQCRAPGSGSRLPERILTTCSSICFD